MTDGQRSVGAALLAIIRQRLLMLRRSIGTRVSSDDANTVSLLFFHLNWSLSLRELSNMSEGCSLMVNNDVRKNVMRYGPR
jgi:hypothetical protein